MEANEATEGNKALQAGDGTRGGGGFCLLASSTEQTCERGGVVNAKCLTSSTNGLYQVSPSASSTTPPESHTSHESNLSHDHGCTSCPIDPALTTCHRGETDASTEIPGSCESRQSICSLETFGDQLYGCELDGAASGLALATATEEKRCQADSEASGQHSSGEEWPRNNLPYFGTTGHRQGSTIPSDELPSSVLSGRISRHVHRWTKQRADAMHPPRKRRRVESPPRLCPLRQHQPLQKVMQMTSTKLQSLRSGHWRTFPQAYYGGWCGDFSAVV